MPGHERHPELQKQIFNMMSADLAWTERDYKSAALTVVRTSPGPGLPRLTSSQTKTSGPLALWKRITCVMTLCTDDKDQGFASLFIRRIARTLLDRLFANRTSWRGTVADNQGC